MSQFGFTITLGVCPVDNSHNPQCVSRKVIHLVITYITEYIVSSLHEKIDMLPLICTVRIFPCPNRSHVLASFL